LKAIDYNYFVKEEVDMTCKEFYEKWPLESWPWEYGLDKIALNRYKEWYEKPNQCVSDWDTKKYRFVCDAVDYLEADYL
jgi:hypothetical protein